MSDEIACVVCCAGWFCSAYNYDIVNKTNGAKRKRGVKRDKERDGAQSKREKEIKNKAKVKIVLSISLLFLCSARLILLFISFHPSLSLSPRRSLLHQRPQQLQQHRSSTHAKHPKMEILR